MAMNCLKGSFPWATAHCAVTANDTMADAHAPGAH